MKGTIKMKTTKNFGFIKIDDTDRDLFFHANALEGISFEELEVGDHVQFEEEDSPKGRCAMKVQRI